MAREQRAHLVVIDARVVFRIEIAVFPAPIRPAPREPVKHLAQMFRSIWSLGAAGVVVPLTVLREGGSVEINVQSAARRDFLKSPSLH